MGMKLQPDSQETTDLVPFLVGYAGLAGFFALERVLRRPGSAASLSASGEDQGTTRKIVVAHAVAAILSPILRRGRVLPLPTGLRRLGLPIEASGLALRMWSMRTLGTSYTRTLQTGDAQPLVEAGPYGLVRHPGYAGSLLTWSGFAIGSGSLPVVALVMGLLGRAHRDRIRAEEELLLRDLPGYSEYARRTWRLVPYLW